MNILPLVLAFLIIFSCISFSFFKDVKSFGLIEHTLHSYHRTERSLNNVIVQRAYRKIKAEPTSKKQSDQTQKKEKKYFSLRSLSPPLENSKFNLTPLIQHQGEMHLHPLYEPLASLLRLLYEEKLFSKEKNSSKLEYRLLDALLKKAKKLTEPIHFAELCPDDPQLKKIYYKMLKGTNQYNSSKGVPPLRDFLSLSKANKAVSLSFASPRLLEALFGASISLEIQKLEREKWEELKKHYIFSKEDLTSLLMKTSNNSPLLAAFDPYLDYSKQFAKRDLIGARDQLTGVGIKKPI